MPKIQHQYIIAHFWSSSVFFFFSVFPSIQAVPPNYCTGWHKKRGTFEKPNKNLRNPRKKIIDRNWTITTCLLRDSNPNYQCLKITSCRWRPPPHMHSFTATTHFKSSHSFVSPCVCCMLCRMRQSHPLLVPWSWKGRTIPLLPLWAVQSLSACTRAHFTFSFYPPNKIFYASCKQQWYGT